MEVNIKCTVKSKHTDELLFDKAERSEKKRLLLGAFEVKVRNQYRLVGDLTFYRATVDKNGYVVQGRKIQEEELTLKEDEHILIIDDPRISVVSGGYGEGAKVKSDSDKATVAGGGSGGGGSVDKHRNTKAGDGIGGTGSGEKIAGSTAGKGYGAPAPRLAGGEEAEGGDGLGGKLKDYAPDGPSHGTTKKGKPAGH